MQGNPLGCFDFDFDLFFAAPVYLFCRFFIPWGCMFPATAAATACLLRDIPTRGGGRRGARSAAVSRFDPYIYTWDLGIYIGTDRCSVFQVTVPYAVHWTAYVVGNGRGGEDQSLAWRGG